LALYEAEVATADAAFGEFYDALRERGVLDQTVLVVTSDHGEEFYEHGRWEHGKSLYTEVLDVPLMVRFPSGQGALVSEPVALTSLFAWIQRWAEFGSREGSPVPPVGEAPAAAGLTISRLQVDGFWGRALTVAGYRYLHDLGGAALFDARRDPGERNDLSERLPILNEALWQQLEAQDLLVGMRRGSSSSSVDESLVPLDADLRERLEALGYVH
jgi:arylsulfatase